MKGDFMMNKSDLVAIVAEKMEVTKKDAEVSLNAVVEAITESLVKGEKIQLIGFGSFEVRKRAARKGRNPQTNEEIKIPASKIPAFKAGQALKDAVNKQYRKAYSQVFLFTQIIKLEYSKIDPILNNLKIQEIYKHNFKAYKNFYDIDIQGKNLMETIKNIYNENTIENAIIKSYEYILKNKKSITKS